MLSNCRNLSVLSHSNTGLSVPSATRSGERTEPSFAFAVNAAAENPRSRSVRFSAAQRIFRLRLFGPAEFGGTQTALSLHSSRTPAPEVHREVPFLGIFSVLGVLLCRHVGCPRRAYCRVETWRRSRKRLGNFKVQPSSWSNPRWNCVCL